MSDSVPMPPDAGERHDGGEGAELTERHKRILSDEKRLMREYPGLWPRFVELALREAEKGRRFSARDVLGGFRSLDLLGSDGKPISIKNEFSSIWARRLVRERPEIRPFITIKHSWLDDYEGEI